MLKVDGVDLLLFLIVVFYVVCCPYTKVEESFNMQALHDITQFGTNLNYYDHLEFPGVVPRTFIGSLLIAAMSYPANILLESYNVPVLYNQIFCRCMLGLVSCLSVAHFRNGVAAKFGTRASQLTGLLLACQFHFCFYMSRTLPNIFALALCLNAFGFWLTGKPMWSIVLLTAATVIFRCDILVLLGPFTLQLLLAKEIQFFDTAYTGIATGVVALALTVAVDSVFWQRLVWPEGVVLFFNTVQNKSSEWGVMSWHWYFSNALLKALNVSILWIIVGVLGFSFPTEALVKTPEPRLFSALHKMLFAKGVNRRVLYYVFPVVAFVALYSILPHKELRFIFPALPLLTMAGGVGLDSVLPADSTALLYPLSLLHADGKMKKKLDRQRLLTVGYYNLYRYATSIIVLLSLSGMLLLASGLLTASHRNYPGGEALDRLLQQHLPMHFLEHTEEHMPLSRTFKPTFVHIDAAAAMSGVTRFLQRRFIWGPSNRLPFTEHRSYLNLRPDQYDHTLNVCFADRAQCAEDVDLVYYSKDEAVTDYKQYDWLITADPSVPLASKHFDVVEEIKAFDSIRLTSSGFVLSLKTELYILVNTADT